MAIHSSRATAGVVRRMSAREKPAMTRSGRPIFPTPHEVVFVSGLSFLRSAPGTKYVWACWINVAVLSGSSQFSIADLRREFEAALPDSQYRP